jgi:hypothetical protein
LSSSFSLSNVCLCYFYTCVCKARHLKISEREKTLWASRRKSSVEINISREKEFIILIIKNILERVSGFFTIRKRPNFIPLLSWKTQLCLLDFYLLNKNPSVYQRVKALSYETWLDHFFVGYCRNKSRKYRNGMGLTKSPSLRPPSGKTCISISGK